MFISFSFYKALSFYGGKYHELWVFIPFCSFDWPKVNEEDGIWHSMYDLLIRESTFEWHKNKSFHRKIQKDMLKKMPGQSLTHIRSLFLFYTPWKCHKTLLFDAFGEYTERMWVQNGFNSFMTEVPII